MSQNIINNEIISDSNQLINDDIKSYFFFSDYIY